MKTIGMIGGSTWVSTVDYYRYINRLVNKELGGVHSAKILMYSFNFNFIKKNAEIDDWQAITKRIIKESRRLIHSGADCIVLCANTLHYVADEVEDNVSVPVIDIADAAGKKIQSKGINKVGLLGTQFTMEKDFYHKKLEKYGIKAITPSAEYRQAIHRIILDELSMDEINEKSKHKILEAINELKNQGADAIVLACTELPLVISAKDVDIPLFNSTLIHSEAIVKWVFKE